MSEPRSTVERVIDPTRQGLKHPDHQAALIGQAKPVSLEEAIATVDGWPPGWAPFGLYQVARALREGLRHTARELEDARHALNRIKLNAANAGVALEAAIMPPGSKKEHYPLSRTLDLMDTWREDVECWGLHQMCRVLREAWASMCRDAEAWETEAHWWRRHWRVNELAVTRASQAIPCGAGKDDCHAPYYRHQPCCNLRVALWPGEEFPTDYLPDEGMIHLFEPGRGSAPRVSAGCVRLVEPTNAPRIMDEHERALCEDLTRSAHDEIDALLKERL